MIKNILARFGFVKSTAGDWKEKGNERPGAGEAMTNDYNPDQEHEELALASVKNPIASFMEALKEGKATLKEAHLFAGRLDVNGKLLKDKTLIGKVKESAAAFQDSPYKIVKVDSAGFISKLEESAKLIESHPAKAKESWQKKVDVATKLKESVDFDFDASTSQFDPGQYTEYTPIMGGPYYRQLYLYDYLTMIARCFEMWNHNPLAKRIVKILTQYSMGRGYKVISKNDKVKAAWEKFEREHNIKHKITKFWAAEYVVTGELMVDVVLWQSIDPSTVWDIICDPNNLEEVYYYHQQYPTAYFQFTGKQVPGVPGSANTKPMEYIIRQLPYDRVIHIKGECFSNEKRGRSKLFPVMGWLKRIKDIYNARVIQTWLQASFIWDDAIDGSQADIDAHLSRYNRMPPPGSIFAHNKRIERKPLAPASSASSGSGNEVAQEIIAFIGSAIGIPKEHLNLLTASGSNRASALTSAEPFTKVIEEMQSDIEGLLHRVARHVMMQAGIEDFKDDEIEFVFPSVTKDTTTETVKNIMAGEASGYIDKEAAAEMYAGEMNITTYDFDDTQAAIMDQKKAGLDQLATGQDLPGGRAHVDGGTPIAGDGKAELKGQLNTL